MKRSVYKFQLTDKDQILEMLPSGSKVLSVKVQRDSLVVYIQVPVFEVNEEQPPMKRIHFYTMDTGEELPDNIDDYTFLDSVYLRGSFTWCHVYYKIME